MVKRWNRLLVAFFVLTDSLLGMIAFVLAYVLRFDAGLIAVAEGLPAVRAVRQRPAARSALLVPLAFQVQGIYRLRRGRTRVDDFFAVFVGSILAVVLGIVTHPLHPGLLRSRRPEGPRRLRGVAAGLGPVPRPQRRAHLRARASSCAKRWSAAGAPGIGLKRVLVAGAGELGRVVAEKILEHRELGYKVVGFVDDKRRRRPPRLSRPAAARHAGRAPATSCSASGSITSTSPCRSTST